MKNIYEKWCNIHVVVKMGVAIVLGVILGIFVKNLTWISLLGDLFVTALKAYAPILVFFLVLSSLAKANGNIGSRFKTVIILYTITTLTAALVAVTVSFVFPVKITLTGVVGSTGSAPSGVGECY